MNQASRIADTQALIERLRARDREWQKSCDLWVKQLADAGQPCSPETEAGMRTGTYGEAAAELARLLDDNERLRAHIEEQATHVETRITYRR